MVKMHMMGVYRTRSGSYGYSIQKGGVRIRKTVGTRDEATEAYLKEKARLGGSDTSTSLGKWMIQVIEISATGGRRVSRNTLSSYRTSFNALLSHFGDIPLATINSEMVTKFVAKRSSTVSNATVNRNLAFLSKCFRLAIERELATCNPVRGIQLEESSGRLRFLTVAEIRKLLSTANGQLKDIIIVAIYTGLRKDEIFSLTWSDIHKKSLTVQRKWKGESYQAVRASQAALEAINRQPRASAYVFPNPSGDRRMSCRTAFENAVQKAGLQDVTFHTLRHTFASHAVMNGMPLKVLQEVLGHSKFDMVLKYAHLADDHVDRILAGVSSDLHRQVSASVISGKHVRGIKRRKSFRMYSGAWVAQLVEHMTENHGVGGSTPPPGTTKLLKR
jgi:integrase